MEYSCKCFVSIACHHGLTTHSTPSGNTSMCRVMDGGHTAVHEMGMSEAGFVYKYLVSLFEGVRQKSVVHNF